MDLVNGVSHRSSNGIANSGRYGERYRWKYGVLPYKFGPEIGFLDKIEIRKALRRMNEQLYPCTNIRPANNDDRDYVKIIRDGGCYSHVGRQGGEQDLSLDYG